MSGERKDSSSFERARLIRNQGCFTPAISAGWNCHCARSLTRPFSNVPENAAAAGAPPTDARGSHHIVDRRHELAALKELSSGGRLEDSADEEKSGVMSL